MASVEEQVRLDFALSGPLADLRSHLERFGVGRELDLLLKHWDDALSTSDFETVAEGYQSLMRNILMKMAGGTASDGRNEALDTTRGHHALLPAAVAGIDHRNLSHADKESLDETLAELSGMLEALQTYRNPQRYLRERESSPWLEEHVNADELTGDDPILLSEFVFDVEQFLSNLIYAQRNFRRPAD